jgi:cellulose 1,4-beta-cellobiosidase
VIDSEWRDAVDDQGRSCYHDGRFNQDVCTTEADCTSKCKLQGFDYAKASVSTTGSSVRLGFLNPDKSIGSRIYLFDETAGTYVNFKMLNKEITFDIDTSQVPCAVNGALYFSEMDADGGMARFPDNKAGAKYGTGYCDAQCPRDGKFVGGKANLNRKYGSCCFEWDIWEGNVGGEQMAAHPCRSTVNTPAYVCTTDCSQCDTAGCAWNPYKIESNIGGQHVYYGTGKKVDPSKKFTVVTQFITKDGTDSGSLKEVRRLYVVGGKVVPNNVKIQSGTPFDSIGNDFCQNGSSGDSAYATTFSGDAGFSSSFKRGAVLAMSIWTDGAMSWLDQGDAGTCGASPGKDALVSRYPNAYVEYSNIRYGDLDTTY